MSRQVLGNVLETFWIVYRNIHWLNLPRTICLQLAQSKIYRNKLLLKNIKMGKIVILCHFTPPGLIILLYTESTKTFSIPSRSRMFLHLHPLREFSILYGLIKNYNVWKKLVYAYNSTAPLDALVENRVTVTKYQETRDTFHASAKEIMMENTHRW